MPDSEHVTDFMGHDPRCSPKYFFVVDWIVGMGEEPRIIAGKRENSGTLTDTSNPKNKVPLISGVKIREGNTNQTKCIWFERFL